MFKIIRFILASGLLAVCNGAFSAQPDAAGDIKRLAAQGDASAQAKLGAMYHLGRGVDKDEEEAVRWMLKAAEQNFVDAEVFMAAMYERGMGVPQDIDTATQWYEKAAAQGQETAQGLLGKHKAMRTRAAAQIPYEYAKKILTQK